MSLEAHHRFILDTMQRNQDIARNIINELEAENARLKAEVERLTDCKAGADRLKAEVERLRKAGDAMAEALEAAGFNNARDFWNAAKEGKQP
jgi:methylphosphotriester-DNA--protein-cysteine methyltransferase